MTPAARHLVQKTCEAPAALGAMLRRAVVDGRMDAVHLGRVLLVLQGALIVSTVSLLEPGSRGIAWLVVVSMAMTVFLTITFVVPWKRISPRASLVFPLVTMLAFGVLGIGEPAVFAPLTGFMTLSFVYIGLTQPTRFAVLLLPVALVAFVLNYGTVSGAIVVRAIIAATVWTTTSSLLAWLTASNAATSDALSRAALVDALTGVPNRRDLQIRLASLSAPASLVLCDLDHFKRINDTLGHAAGDRVLADFGSLLRVELRENDYCARYGGEEFVIVVPTAQPAALQSLLARLRERWAVLQPDVTFSTGSAAYAGDRSPEAVLAAADQALYAAKHAGRNTDRFETQVELAPRSARVA